MTTQPKLNTLLNQARGGRVVRTAFLDQEELDRRLLGDPEVQHQLSGGFPDSQRVVLTLYPAHIPAVDSGICMLRLLPEQRPPLWDQQDVRVQLRRLGLAEDQIGDLRPERNGSFLLALTEKAAQTLETADWGERTVQLERLGEAAAQSHKVREVVVPSLRIDVVGAKGFGVSRAYFQQGVEAGKVRLNGQIARASSEIRAGDSLSAEGMGRIDFKRVVNETRRGNFKIELEVARL